VTPAHVVLLENVPHPLDLPVENAVLDLTTDNMGEVISTIASFTVTKPILSARYSRIKKDYSFAPLEDKPALSAEYGAVKKAYVFAPS